jgi:hypothetical protein
MDGIAPVGFTPSPLWLFPLPDAHQGNPYTMMINT